MLYHIRGAKMEHIVIIKMSETIKDYVNHCQSNGLQISCQNGSSKELNSGHEMHGRISSRVFIISNASTGEKCNVFIGDKNNPKSQKNFILSAEEEYTIIDF